MAAVWLWYVFDTVLVWFWFGCGLGVLRYGLPALVAYMRYVFGVVWLGLLVWCWFGIVMVRFGYGCGMMLVWLSQGFGMVWVRFRDGCDCYQIV